MDSEAYKLARQMNDQVKAQGKHRAELLQVFAPLTELFGAARSAKRDDPAPLPPSPAPLLPVTDAAHKL